MQREHNSGRYVEEEAPDGTVVIYDSKNTHAWLQSDEPVDIHQMA
jgi:hypothetical protein